MKQLNLYWLNRQPPVPSNLFIFEDGDEKTDITGGYLSYPYGHEGHTNTSDQNLNITSITGGVRLTNNPVPNDDNFRAGIYTTNNGIDVTHYSTIRFNFNYAPTGTYTTTTNMYCGLIRNVAQNFTPLVSTGKSDTSFSGNIELDISSITGVVYPYLEIYCGNFQRSARIDLFEIELIR